MWATASLVAHPFPAAELMHYKLLGFSQNGAVRTYRFHRIGVLGTAPVPFTVLADTDVARQHNVTLQELPTLCSRLLNAINEDRPPDTLILGEADVCVYGAELAARNGKHR